MASHEFRTPLSTILSSAYLIEQYVEKDDQPKREKHLNRIVSAVNNLTNILNEFLSVGKIEEGKIVTHLTECSINDFLNALLKEIKHTLKKGQYLNLTHEGNEKVITDQNLLKNIMLNLISNAIKFSAEESKIDIKTANDSNYFTIEVRDYGIGISEEDQGHLMERFFRGSNVTNIQGTGLGLHIVSKYVETLGGKLTFKSNLEEGTSIQIIFNHLKLKEHEDNLIN
jgi:signal transduction histidine kinase